MRAAIVQDALTDDDHQDLLLMFKALHGLLPDGTTAPKPQPLQKGMVSGAPKSKANVVHVSEKQSFADSHRMNHRHSG